MLDSVIEHFDLPITQMTDLKTEIFCDRAICAEYGPLAQSRIYHMANYHHDELLMLDCDILVRKSIEHIFDKDFDIALTRRPGSEPGSWAVKDPFNTGVVFSRCNEFWQDCKEELDSLSPELKKIGGEQRSINHVAKRGDYKLLEIPGRKYNWSPQTRGYREGDDVHIVHYKGGRKEYM